MKKILVTGSNGFMGSHLVEMLLDNGDNKVKGMVLQDTDEKNLDDAKKSKKFEIIYADLTDPPSLEHATQDIDIIYHLAATVSDWGLKELFNKIIFEGTRNLVEAAMKNGVKRVIFMSSLAVHGLDGHVNADEKTPYKAIPYMHYSGAKIKAEEYLLSEGVLNSIETVIVRPGFEIVGPRNVVSFYRMAENVEKGTFGVINGGKKLISLVYVKNLMAALIHLGNLDGASGEVYIARDVSWTWKKYLEEICSRLECKIPKLNVSYWLIAPFILLIDFFARLFKAKNSPVLNRYRINVPRNDIDFSSQKLLDTGFKAPFTFEEGLDASISWYKKIKEERS
ncbi:MAG: NAD-dependent epimerase/dehydratase family protein [Candidatus Hodarchaeota archaeon]